jgi:hypothetical protein
MYGWVPDTADVIWNSVGPHTLKMSSFAVGLDCATATSLQVNTLLGSAGVPSIVGPNSISVCQGSNSTFSAANYAGYSLTWTAQNATIVSGQGTSNVQVNWSSSGTGKLILTAISALCYNSDTVNAMVRANLPFSLGPDTTSCATPVALSGPINQLSYAWSTGATSSGIVATVTGTYSLVATDTNGCQARDTVQVSVNQPTLGSLSLSSCNSVTVNNQTFTLSGIYTQPLTNTVGCDSTLTLNLTVHQPTSGSLTQTACNAITVNNQTYTSSGTYSQMLTNVAGCDSTLTLNLTVNQPTSGYLTQTACNAITVNNQTYTLSGTYSQHLTNVAGCDSTLTLNLTVHQPTSGSLTQTAGNAISVNNQTYTSSGTYSQHMTNVAGCDSTLTLNLTIRQPSAGTFSQSACGSFTINSQTYTSSGTYTQMLTNAAGCDSTLTLNLTIRQPSTETLTQTGCGSIAVNNQTYTSSGTYTQMLTNAAGCDSTLTLNLTIVAVDTSVTVSGVTLFANANGATYQWLDCNSSLNPIPGATGQSFAPIASGLYAVVVGIGNCADTSACWNSTVVAIEEVWGDEIRGYPNPNHGEFTLEFGRPLDIVEIFVYDLTGKMVYKMHVQDQATTSLNLHYLSKGVYAVEVKAGERRKVLRMAKI